MRFPRNAKIFRGQLDMTPFVNVFFLLVIFVVLGSLLYMPGIPFRLQGTMGSLREKAPVVSIFKNGEIVFNSRTNKIENLENLRTDFSNLPPDSLIFLKSETGAPREIAVHIREQAKKFSLVVENADATIELPVAEGFSGTANPTIVVAVSFGGQLFYQNRLVSEGELTEHLRAAVKNSKQSLTLLLLADKSVLTEVTTRVMQLAQQAGIKEVLQVTRPPKG